MNDINNMMTVEETAKRLQVGKQKVRTGLISGKLPFGAAIFEEKANCYSFIIPRKRFEAWESGDDLKITPIKFDELITINIIKKALKEYFAKNN